MGMKAIRAAFMDRAIMEGDPHSLLEGMLICAYALMRTMDSSMSGMNILWQFRT